MPKVTNLFKGKLKTYFVKRLGAFEYKHGWLRVPICPFCNRENKLGINLSLYRTNCFRCGYHSNPLQLVMDVEGFDTYNEAINFLNRKEFNELSFTEERVELSEQKTLYLPEYYTNIRFGRSETAKAIRSYLFHRGFSLDYLSKHGIGYCTAGPLFGYVIIPFYYQGTLRYYNARRVLGSGPRYNNPNKDLTGLGKEFIIFNHDALEEYRTIYICEGAFNALTLGDQAIATQGKAFSRYQLNQIIKSPCKHVIILLDPDAKNYALKLAFSLIDYKKVKVVFLPEGKDVNDLGKNTTLSYVYKTRYQSYQDLIELRNSLT